MYLLFLSQFLLFLESFRGVEGSDPTIAIGASVVVIHHISIIPNKVSAWPKNDDEEAEDARVDNLAGGTLLRDSCDSRLMTVRARDFLRKSLVNGNTNLIDRQLCAA